MNFRPTTLKVIFSIIIVLFIFPVILGILFGLTSNDLNLNNPTPIIWFYIIIGFVLIYTIWSLIQKNKKNLGKRNLSSAERQKIKETKLMWKYASGGWRIIIVLGVLALYYIVFNVTRYLTSLLVKLINP